LEKKAVSGIMLVSLLTVLALVSFTSLLRAQSSEGDWIVMGVEVVENKTILLNGNLTVKAGGSLTLRNVTLRMNVEQNGQYGISVEEGGSLSIYDSNISSATEFRFFFSMIDGRLVMEDSELHGAGFGEWGEGGLWIQADDTLIDGNLISDCYGVVLNGSDNWVINNRFMNIDSGIFIHNPSGGGPKHNLIVNNTIHAKENGIWIIRSSDNVITNNTLDAMVGIRLGGSWDNFVANNRIIMEHHPDPWAGIVLDGGGNNTIANNTIHYSLSVACGGAIMSGIEVVRSVDNKIEGNSIEGVQGGVVLSYSHNNVVTNNVLSNISQGVAGTWHFYIPSLDAIQLYHSSSNVVINNRISLVQSNAIILWDEASNNTIQANVINSSYNGISLHYSSDNNRIINNLVSEIRSWSVILDESNGNTLYHNGFLDPLLRSYDDGLNRWDSDGQGNYWGNYEGQDKDGDGISDVPHRIPPNGTDIFPIMNPKPVTFVPVPEWVKLKIIPHDPYGSTVIGTISTEETWKNMAVTTSFIHIKEGGSLTLRNVTLTIYPFGNGIWVDSGGSMYIYNSTITAADPKYGGYNFNVANAYEFVMKNSELRYCGSCFQTDFPGGLVVGGAKVTIENNIFAHNYRGVWVGAVISMVNNKISYSYDGIVDNQNVIGNNTILKIIHAGIFGGDGAAFVENNNITHVWAGAVMLNKANRLTVINNSITSSEVGVLLFTSVSQLGDNNITVVNNRISDAWRWAIQVTGSEHRSAAIVVANNTISSCAGVIYLSPGSHDTLVYHNNMINSPDSSDLGSNNWDNGYPSGGNYWSDYTGVDVKRGSSQDMPGSDGIGDSTYIIDVDSIDHFPLMCPYGSPPPRTYRLTITTNAEGTTDPTPGAYDYTTNSTVQVKAIPNAGFSFSHWLLDNRTIYESPLNIVMDTDRTLLPYFIDIDMPVADAGPNQTVNVGSTVNFDAGGSSDNVGIVSYEWDFGDGTIGTDETTSHTYTNPGTYTVVLTAKDAAGNSATRPMTITVLPTEAFPTWILGIFVAIAIAAATTLLWRRRKCSLAEAELKRGSPAKNV